MKFSWTGCVLWALTCCVEYAAAVASTDSYSDADLAQTGYLPNHNMDPAVVDSVQFGQLWKVSFNAKEQFYAKPLVFTPAATGVQILFLASSQNYIRTLNAKTGAILNTRQVHTPFLQSDIGCTDIPNTIGIIGTPVIDPVTEIAYFFSKTYISNYRVAGNTGVPNGVYYFHGVSLDTLQDVPGFPILIDGSVADNDAQDYFVGGVILQRPSLVQVGNYVYGGFGGHCDLFNYTGLVVGIDVVNKKIASQWAVSVGPLTPHTNNLLQNGGGGEGGIWQSGVGLSTDGSRLFFATGNGNADQNNGVPSTGRTGCQTLGESVVNLQIDTSTGKLSAQDYFQPYDYQNMDGGDQDFGSGGVTLLDPTVFKGTGVSRMAVGAGKNGKIYIMNADNLGGYKQGPGGSDGVIQTINTQKAVFGGSGSYPLEGGYLYSTPVGYPTYVYQLGFDAAGVPQFAQVATTKETSAGRVGTGVPTITSLDGQPGTAILWMTDPDAGIRAWYAVPKSGIMKSIAMPQIQGVTKFQRPVFGDSRLYTTDASGNLYCLGSPVNLPLNCSSPVDFGSVALGSTSKQMVNCTALININQIASVQTADANFVVHLTDLPTGAISAGQQFSFPVTWNLSHAVVANAVNASFGSTTPGFKSTPLTITTNNAIPGFATIFPISLTGKEISKAPFLDTTPSTVDFGGVILVGADGDSDGKTIGSTMTIRNDGLADLQITGYAWTQDEIDDDDVDWTNVTQSDNGTSVVGPGFYITNLPPVGSVLQASQSVVVNLVFAPNDGIGNYFSFFNIWTNGGVTDTILEGSASTAPVANISISTNENGWNDVTSQSAPVMDFGYVQAGSAPQSLQIRICNEGGSALDISKSKPPNGIFYISDPAELHEELQIPPNTCAYGTVFISPPTEHYNEPDQLVNNTWTLNTDDLNFGVHVVQMQAVIQSTRIGPQSSTGNPLYTYLGCFQDNTNGKLLPNRLYAGNNNTNDLCQNLAIPGGYVFSGTEYQIECYAGNTPPPLNLQVQDSLCNYACAGNGNDTCGGPSGNGLISVFYDATRYTPGSNATSAPGGLPIPSNVGNFTYSGCWSDNVNGRALGGFAPTAPANGTTYQSCAAACIGFEFFGVEFGNQCYCGNSMNNGAALQASTNPDVNGCGMFCQGNSSQYCGGPNRLNVFQYNGTVPVIPSNGAGNNGNNNNNNNNNGGATGPAATSVTQNVTSNGYYSYFGCWLDNVAGRALTMEPLTGQTVTPDTCAAACSGYQYAGLEYGDECYCANSIGGNSTIAPGGSNSAVNGCNMACAGNSNLTCGGPNRLSVYSLNANANVTRIVDPVTVGNFGNWSYQGCYSEATNGRALSQVQMPIPGSSVTVQTCAAACLGYTYAGVEYSSQCFCSNFLAAGSNLVAGSTPASTGCNMLCAANSTQYCGGPNRLNLYMASQAQSSSSSSTSSMSSSAPAQSSTSLSSSFISPSSVISAATSSGASSSSGLSATSSSSYSSSVTASSSSSISSTASLSGSLSSTSTNSIISSSSPTVSSSMSYGASPSLQSSSISTSLMQSASSSSVLQTSSSTSSTASSSSSASINSSASSSMSSLSSSSASIVSSTSSTSSTASLSSSASAVSSTSSSTSSVLSSSVTISSSTTSASSTSSSPLGSSAAATSSSGSSSMSSPVPSSSVSQSITSASSSTNLPLSSSSVTSSTGLSSSSGAGGSSSSSLTSSAMSTQSSSLASSSTSSTTSSTSSSSTSSQSAAATIAGGWTAYGCYTEATNMRALSDLQNPISGNNVTNENCAKACAGYTFFGTEYSSECYCGYKLNTGSVPATSGCNMPCSGNNAEICGGGNRLTVYKSQSSPPAQPITVGNSTGVQYLGCYSEATNSRALTDKQYAVPAANVTVEACMKACVGFRFWGLEYASQCFCGNTIHTGSALVQGSTPSQTGCNMVCQGNSTEYCGGPNRLNMYMRLNATTMR